MIKVNYLSWGKIDEIINKVSEQIKKEEMPDIIIAIQRGGFIPGVMLSHSLGVREVIPLDIRRTTDDSINARKFTPVFNGSIDIKQIKGKKVLIVDDIAGTGQTYKAISEYLKSLLPKAIKSFVCVVNMDNWEKFMNTSPNEEIEYIGNMTRGWTIFPWEKSIERIVSENIYV